jgi:hypothetical protein
VEYKSIEFIGQQVEWWLPEAWGWGEQNIMKNDKSLITEN